jgi:hypothetical protein
LWSARVGDFFSKRPSADGRSMHVMGEDMASVKSWWRAAFGVAALGLALTSSVVSGFQADPATPEAGGRRGGHGSGRRGAWPGH